MNSLEQRLGMNALPAVSLSRYRIFRRIVVAAFLGCWAVSASAAALSMGNVPLRFEPNVGQAPGGTDFVVHGMGYGLSIQPSGIALQMRRRTTDPAGVPAGSSITVSLIGARPARSEGLDPLPSISNYFLGKTPARWNTNVPNYARVAYRGIYPGVDLFYYGQDGRLEYDFAVAPGTDPKSIVLSFGGADSMTLDTNGDLVLQTSGNQIRMGLPSIYQQLGAVKQPVAGSYRLLGGNLVRFDVGNYDESNNLIIDPVLTYSTYVGGSSWDEGVGFALDSSGNTYVAGWTTSGNFPVTSAAYQSTLAGGPTFGDVFIYKMNPTGTALVYSTYIGGSNDDLGWGVAVDSSGNAYITGYTSSADFPTTPGAFKTNFSGTRDAFVVKLNSTGSALTYSTYLGGNSEERGYAIALDSAGSAYVAGFAKSTNFPVTSGAYQTTNPGGATAFITKFNATGSGLVYSTYVGGSSDDWANALAIDSSGNAYLAGYTQSSNFPTTSGAFQRTFGTGLGHAFVTKVNATGTGLVYSTFLRSSAEDFARAIALDNSGNAYVGGRAGAADFPVTAGAYQTTFRGVNDAFVTKLNSSGTGLQYSTLLGGSDNDQVEGIAVDASGAVVAVGLTVSTDFPVTPDALQSAPKGYQTGWISKLSSTGANLVYSTYLGGSGGTDLVIGVALDSAGNSYFMGYTNSPDFPTTPGVFQPYFGGGTGNSFVAKLAFGCSYTINPLSQTISAAGGSLGPSVTTASGCSWTSTSNASWISVISGSGTGSGTASLSVAANTDAARSGTATVAGQIFTVNQAAASVNVTISSNPTGRTIVVDSVSYTSPQTFSWPIGSTHSVTIR